ncbi:expressed unknown protein [Seminavis robusta]|uniref:Uncharacterized protein n=1 Tax=Seminavis robusta TaxID=568900 RepID=A0A9N8DPX0_9STRA|nr:expressed unknown protein [Seminavis robusta]|eukprot:Sro205_g086230.1 n/a (400) ;mRNA; f:40334-41643
MQGVRVDVVVSMVMVLVGLVLPCLGQGDLDVTVTGVSAYSLSFDTGPGMPEATNTVEIQIFDKCRMQGQGQKDQGYWFPSSTVTGIEAEVSDVNNAPGTGNTITYRFVEGIEGNTDVYTKLDSTTAILSFCVQVGLYINGYLANWEEVRVHYDIDLATDINDQGDPMVFVASAEGFVASAEETGLDENSMVGYFCDPQTLKEIPGGSATMTQGSTVTTCFEVVDEARRSLQGNGNGKNKHTQFEMSDIMDLLIKDLGDSQAAQSIIVASQNARGVGFAKKACRKKGKSTVTCSVSFLLKADFYDYNAAQLTGEGSAVVDLGEAGRRHLVKFRTSSENNENGLRRLGGAQVVAPTAVKPTAFKVERRNFDRRVSGAASNYSMVGVAWAAFFVVSIVFFSV